MNNKLKEFEHRTVQKTLREDYTPGVILEARRLQDEFIVEKYKFKKIDIADIGSGDGYHGEMFAPFCRSYTGFEISPEMAKYARARWQKLGLQNTKIFVGDATEARLQPGSFDVVWCLYFTPGNIRDQRDDLAKYDDAYLDKNPRFIALVRTFYRALRSGGQMLLTIYKDVAEAEKAQIEFYRNTGQTVITPAGSRFVATVENFWSARWTKASMLSNLAAAGISPSDVTFHSLNSISWLVEIEN
jgi:SAM-dependent methyltransferase